MEGSPGEWKKGEHRSVICDYEHNNRTDRRTRASLFAGVATVVYRCGDQTDGKETRGGNHAQAGTGNNKRFVSVQAFANALEQASK